MKTKPYIFFRALLGGMFRILYRVHIHGRENEPSEEKGPYIAIANHTSNIDPVLLCIAAEKQQINYMAKKELFKVPVIGTVVRWLGAFPIDRAGSDVGALRNTIEMLKQGKSIGLFPQGHRFKEVDPSETEIKPGLGLIALRSGAMILPCYIKTKNNCLKMFKRTDIYIGKPVTAQELVSDMEVPKKDQYLIISELAFKKCLDSEKLFDNEHKGINK